MPILSDNVIISRNPEITAYEIAVAEGFVGTKTEWLASLGNELNKDFIEILVYP